MNKMKGINMGDACVYCENDTSFGSGRFVNRISACVSQGIDDDEKEGYMCEECQSEDCDKCGIFTADYILGFTEDMDILCIQCYEGHEIINLNQQ